VAWLWPALISFVVGAVYDALNAGFIHVFSRGRPVASGLFSMFVGGCGVTGLWEATHRPSSIPFLLAGYFVGTYAAVKWKNKQS